MRKILTACFCLVVVAFPPMILRADDPAEPANVRPAFSGRFSPEKEALLKRFGGDDRTEQAVAAGLEWLSRQQRKDGSWSLKGPYSSVSLEPRDIPASATAMALLALQGSGSTHKSGPFQQTVARGQDALLKFQQDDGNFFNQDVGRAHNWLYTHAQCTMAICDLYGGVVPVMHGITRLFGQFRG